MSYPNLLFVTPCAFNQLSGGGITFTNLFRGWPADKIATVTSDAIPPTTDICKKYYHLSQKEFSWIWPFSLAQTGMEKNLKSSSGRQKHSYKLLKLGRRIIGDEVPTSVRLSPELKKWIAQFNPQALYTILGNIPYIRLVRAISREFDLPIIIHMMDDWPAVLYRRGIFGPYYRSAMQRELSGLIKEASACLGICDAMSEAYTKRYGKQFHSFHNALDTALWLQKSRTDWKRGSPFRIVYAGALMEDSQLKSVCDARDAVVQLCAEGMDLAFEIYTPWYFANRYRAEIEHLPHVRVYDAPEDDIAALFAKADLLLLPVNFDAASVNYIRYSMPTKIPAYMLSGTPTLAYGPVEVASIQYAQQWAHCVTQQNPEALKIAIKALAENEELRKKLALGAQAVGKERHDAAKVRGAFHALLDRGAR